MAKKWKPRIKEYKKSGVRIIQGEYGEVTIETNGDFLACTPAEFLSIYQFGQKRYKN